MGLIIGNTPGILGPLTSSSRVRPITLFEPSDRARPHLPKNQPGNDFPQITRDKDTLQIGIGQGAASNPELALKTVTRNVEEVKRHRLTRRSQYALCVH